MQTLLALLKRKPSWLASEGYWRILQIIRLVAFAPFAVFGVGFIVCIPFESSKALSMFGAGLAFLGMGVAAFLAVHWIAWTIVWVKVGFAETKNG